MPKVREPSGKERRETENSCCVGGLRSPWQSVLRLNHIQEIAAKVRKVIEAFIEEFPVVLELVRALQLDGVARQAAADKALAPGLIAELRLRLGRCLGTDDITPTLQEDG